jgi:hypothetical protein
MMIPRKAVVVGDWEACIGTECRASTLSEVLLERGGDVIGVTEIEVLGHVNGFECIHQSDFADT